MNGQRVLGSVDLLPAGGSNVQDDEGAKGPASFLLSLEHLI